MVSALPRPVKVTRNDVARAAGTSTAVVSYVVNDGPRSVAPATRARVLKAIEQLGYRPNATARALRSNSSQVIGLLLPDMTNPFFAELAIAVEDAAIAAGCMLFVGNTMRDGSRGAGHLASFTAHRVRGVIIIGGEGVSTGIDTGVLQATGTPVAYLDRVPGHEIAGAGITVENRDGARLATQHLLDHGHRSVLGFGGPDHLSSSHERRAGWVEALVGAGIEVTSQLEVRTAYSRYEAYRAFSAMLEHQLPADAIFVHSDEQAIGLLHAASAHGVDVPADIAIVSFDGIRESAITTPTLTTIQQPLAELGRLAVRQLLDPTGEPTTTRLPIELVRRESCGCRIGRL